MKKILFWSVASIVTLLVLVQCKPNTEKTEAVKTEESVVEELNSHQITVKEVLNANAYTYLLVIEAEQTISFRVTLDFLQYVVGEGLTDHGFFELRRNLALRL